MKTYLDYQQIVTQLLGMGIVFITLHFGLHVPVLNLFLFWILPLITVRCSYFILEAIYRQEI